MLFKRRNTPYCTSRCLYFILWACSLVVISCHSDEEWLEPVPYKVLNTIKSTTDITFAQVVKFLTTEEGITEEQVRPYKIRSGILSQIWQAQRGDRGFAIQQKQERLPFQPLDKCRDNTGDGGLYSGGSRLDWVWRDCRHACAFLLS